MDAWEKEWEKSMVGLKDWVRPSPKTGETSYRKKHSGSRSNLEEKRKFFWLGNEGVILEDFLGGGLAGSDGVGNADAPQAVTGEVKTLELGGFLLHA